jgi:hypothetical protein
MAITISDLPVAVLVMMVSGTMASILGIKLAGKAGIGRIATAITRERRVLR